MTTTQNPAAAYDSPTDLDTPKEPAVTDQPPAATPDRYTIRVRTDRTHTDPGGATSDWEMTGPIHARDIPGNPTAILDVLLEQARTAHPHADEIIAEARAAPDLDTLAVDDTPVASARDPR